MLAGQTHVKIKTENLTEKVAELCLVLVHMCWQHLYAKGRVCKGHNDAEQKLMDDQD
jgi:hypothetical protein